MSKRWTVALLAVTLLMGACDSTDDDGVGSTSSTAIPASGATIASPSSTATSEGEVMELTSSVFDDQGSIPPVYTCDGDNISPPLHLEGIPAGTRSLTLILEDPDAPSGTYDHWVAFDIPPSSEIPEDVGDLGIAGRNSSGSGGYVGPCPPSGIHHYIFTAYALDTELGLAPGAGKAEVRAAVQGHVLAEASLTGLFSR